MRRSLSCGSDGAITAEEVLSAGCKKGATVERRSGIGIDACSSRRASPASPPSRAAAVPVPPAPPDPEVCVATTRRPVSASQTLSGQRRNCRRRAKENRLNVESQLQTPCKNEAAWARLRRPLRR